MTALLYKNKANKIFAFYFLSHRWKQISRNQQENDRNPTQKLKPQKAIGASGGKDCPAGKGSGMAQKVQSQQQMGRRVPWSP